MAALKDSLNYGKFDFIDSDDEDYVEQNILKQSLDPKATSASIRNAAAHAMFKKEGKVETGKIKENISTARVGMEEQLKELQEQMSAFDTQKEKLESISTPEEAAAFFEQSGLSEKQIMNMMRSAAQPPEGTEKVESTMQSVDNFASEMEKITKDIGRTTKTNTAPPPTTTKKSKKKIVIQDDSDDSSSDDDIDTGETPTKVKYVPPPHEKQLVGEGEQFFITMEKIGSIAELSLSINNLCLIVEEQEGASTGPTKREKYYFKADFEKEVDDEKIKAKWKKKTHQLSVKVCYA